MKYTNASRLSGLGLIALIAMSMTGCSSMEAVFSEPEVNNTQTNPQEPVQQASTGEQVAEPVLTPMQQKVLDLKSKPNLYLSGQTSVDANTKSLFEQALQAKQANNPELAAKLLVTLTQTRPDLSGPWVQLGDLKMADFNATKAAQWQTKQDLLNEAKGLYQKAVGVNQHNYFAHNRLARVNRELGQFDQAEAHYENAIAAWPGFDNSYVNLGILYDLYMGKKEEALAQYELYQAMQEKPIRQVRGWIADLKRQLAKAAKVSSTGGSK